MPGNDNQASLEAIWQVVSHIPPGQVASYGDVARRAGLPGKARLVGYALSKLPADSRIPWHRVINAQRRLSFPPDSEPYETQKHRLLQEGVTFRGLRVCPAADQTPSP